MLQFKYELLDIICCNYCSLFDLSTQYKIQKRETKVQHVRIVVKKKKKSNAKTLKKWRKLSKGKWDSFCTTGLCER